MVICQMLPRSSWSWAVKWFLLAWWSFFHLGLSTSCRERVVIKRTVHARAAGSVFPSRSQRIIEYLELISPYRLRWKHRSFWSLELIARDFSRPSIAQLTRMDARDWWLFDACGCCLAWDRVKKDQVYIGLTRGWLNEWESCNSS